MYYPRLAGKRVALLANHTSRIGERHLVDILHARGFDVTAIFAPEHGFRGTADSGEHMARGGLPTRRCTRSRWREQVGCGRVIPKLYRAIGCLRRFRAGSHWSGSAQSQRNAHRRTDSRRTIRGGVEYVCRIIVEGYAADEIRSRWREDIGLFRIQRKPSLLYEERPLFRSIRE
uniref:exo-beta-N-acetylmuramidase NamZ domain-containing protein n=1 Tax=Alistipes putredinis TaxID=28117 RepID=UPI003FD863CC